MTRLPCTAERCVGGPGVLLVVSVGVALGVFVGGILLTIAALFMKRSARDPPLLCPRPGLGVILD